MFKYILAASFILVDAKKRVRDVDLSDSVFGLGLSHSDLLGAGITERLAATRDTLLSQEAPTEIDSAVLNGIKPR